MEICNSPFSLPACFETWFDELARIPYFIPSLALAMLRCAPLLFFPSAISLLHTNITCRVHFLAYNRLAYYDQGARQINTLCGCEVFL